MAAPDDDCFKSAKTEPDLPLLSYYETLQDSLKRAAPIVLSNIFFLLMQLTNLYFIGRASDELTLASVGMGNMIINVVCLAFTTGLNGTLETFVSQAYGKEEYCMCGI